jgi:hypothetical protein
MVETKKETISVKIPTRLQNVFEKLKDIDEKLSFFEIDFETFVVQSVESVLSDFYADQKEESYEDTFDNLFGKSSIGLKVGEKVKEFLAKQTDQNKTEPEKQKEEKQNE